MKKGRLSRITAVTMAAVLLVCGSHFSVTAAKTKEQLENEIASLEEKKAQIEGQLSDAKSDLSESQKRKDLIDSQIDTVEQQIDLLDQQLSGLNAQVSSKQREIEQTEAEIRQKEEEIAATRERVDQYLRVVVKTGDLSSFQLLLNTDNFTDYLLKSQVIRRITAKGQAGIDALEAAIGQINEKKAALEQDKKKLEEQKDDVLALKSKSDAKKRELDTLCAAAQTEVRNLQSTVSGYNSQLKRTEEAIEQANNAITELIRQASQSAGGSTGTYNGKMFWPVPTVRALSDVYGPRWGTMHRGIDIANGPIPIYGENIVAAADGTVIAVNNSSYYGTGWSYGYGYSCIISHGKNSSGQEVSTLYAHCSAMYAYVGQKVVGGQTVIGRAGKSGDVTGPHLHFEVRLDGVAVNPLYTYVSPNVN